MSFDLGGHWVPWFNPHWETYPGSGKPSGLSGGKDNNPDILTHEEQRAAADAAAAERKAKREGRSGGRQKTPEQVPPATDAASIEPARCVREQPVNNWQLSHFGPHSWPIGGRELSRSCTVVARRNLCHSCATGVPQLRHRSAVLTLTRYITYCEAWLCMGSAVPL